MMRWQNAAGLRIRNKVSAFRYRKQLLCDLLEAGVELLLFLEAMTGWLAVCELGDSFG